MGVLIPRRLQQLLGVVALAIWFSAAASAATFNPVLTFGGDDGWRAPLEFLPGDATDTDNDSDGFYDFLNDNEVPNLANLERGIGYNPTTGNVLLLSRFGDPNVAKGLRILDGTSGVDQGFLDFTSDVVTGGTFTRNMIAVADDGAIYMANLTTNATSSPFKIYRWENESAAAPTLVYSGSPLADARMGDTFDVIGSGVDTRIVAGYGATSATGDNSFAIFDTADGVNFSATHVNIAGMPPSDGDFRLGITFKDEDTVYGTQGPFVREVDVSGGTGTLVNSFITDGSSLRPMDFAIVDGRPLLAIQEASPATDPIARARIFVYDLSLGLADEELAGRKIAEASALPAGEIQQQNINGTGQVRFGEINGLSAIIYGLSTNNGIQAFELTLDPQSADNADFDGSNRVDGGDFLTWQQNFEISDGAALQTDGDANGDGNVNGVDLGVWGSQYGSNPNGAATLRAIPEPTCALLSMIAAAALIGRRGACRFRTLLQH